MPRLRLKFAVPSEISIPVWLVPRRNFAAALKAPLTAVVGLSRPRPCASRQRPGSRPSPAACSVLLPAWRAGRGLSSSTSDAGRRPIPARRAGDHCPPGVYRLSGARKPDLAALAFLLGAPSVRPLQEPARMRPRLVAPDGIDARRSRPSPQRRPGPRPDRHAGQRYRARRAGGRRARRRAEFRRAGSGHPRRGARTGLSAHPCRRQGLAARPAPGRLRWKPRARARR